MPKIALKTSNNQSIIPNDTCFRLQVYVWHNSIRRSKCMKPADYKKLKKLEKENFDNYKSLTKDLIICK